MKLLVAQIKSLLLFTGDFPDFEAELAEGNMALVNFSVTETTKGEPSMNYFALDFGGIPSGPIAKDASAEDVSKNLILIEQLL